MSKFIVLLCLFSIPSFSQDTLEAIEVNTDKDVYSFTFATSESISEEELQTQPTPLIGRQLDEVPGVIANQNGGPGGRVSFFLRGTESRHVSFVLDGLKLNDPSNNDRQFDSAFFTSPFLKEIIVHKGPQAVLFGSDAFGGTIELVTKKGEKAPQTRVNINGGSFGTVDASISNDWGNKEHHGTVTATRFHTDGISRLNKKRFDATERDGSDITQLTSSSRHHFGEKVRTDFLLSYLRGENELDGFGSMNPEDNDNSHDESQNDQYILQQKTQLKLDSKQAVSLRNGLNRHQRFVDQLDFTGNPVETTFAGNLIQNEILYRYQEEVFNFIGGFSTEHEDLQMTGLDRNFDLHSGFGQVAVRLGNFKFHAGGRSEKHTRYGSFHTGSGGVALKVSDSIFSVQYSQGFKTPSLYQLHATSAWGPLGNPDLVPEVNHFWEGSWQFAKDNFETHVSFFQNRLSNLITYTMANGFINQGRFITEGVEVGGKIKNEFMMVSSSYTHQEFRKAETDVLRRPLNSLILGVAVFPTEKTEVSLKGKFFDSRKDYDEMGSIEELSGYEVFDAGFKIAFDKMDFGVQVLNIFDRKYEELYGYNVMPRSVFVHSGFTF